MSKDGLDLILDRLRAAAPDYPEDKLRTAALQIRHDMGGGPVYIKKAPAEGKAFRLGIALAAGVPLAQAFADVGVGRRQGYYLVKRRWLSRA
jgi:hypothetical protein